MAQPCLIIVMPTSNSRKLQRQSRKNQSPNKVVNLIHPKPSHNKITSLKATLVSCPLAKSSSAKILFCLKKRWWTHSTGFYFWKTSTTRSWHPSERSTSRTTWFQALWKSFTTSSRRSSFPVTWRLRSRKLQRPFTQSARSRQTKMTTWSARAWLVQNRRKKRKLNSIETCKWVVTLSDSKLILVLLTIMTRVWWARMRIHP